MKVTQDILIQELTNITSNNIQIVREQFIHQPAQLIFTRPDSNSWSVADCLEHLNLYGDFYIPVILQFIESQSKSKSNKDFVSGLIGNYFANTMKVQPGKSAKNKMNTFKDKNPIYQSINSDVIDRFLNQQTQMLSILEKAKTVNLNKKGIPITIAQWFKLKLGDALRFTIYHNERHINQAVRAYEVVSKK